MATPAKTGKKQANQGQFKPGKSGNPKGRPQGSRNKATILGLALLEEEALVITRKVVELAKTGNPMALRLCLERLIPLRRDRPVALTLPKVEQAGDIPRALSAILVAVAASEITPTEGRDLAQLLEAMRNAIETAELEERLRILEEELDKQKVR